MATIDSGETVIVAAGSSRTFVPNLTVSGTLEVQGTVTITDEGAEMLGKSRAEGRRQLITRADGTID